MNLAGFSPSADLPPLIRAQIDERLGRVDACLGRISRAAATVAPTRTSSVIAAHRDELARAMNAVGEWITEFLEENPSPAVIQMAREAIIPPIRAWSRTSPILTRVLNTPRDRLNSFEITELLLENRPRGADLISEALDDFYQHMATVNAYRARVARIVSRVAAESAQRAASGKMVRILNLHSCSAPELALLVKSAAFARAVSVTCVDADTAALRRARQRLEDHLPGRAQFVRADPRTFIAAGLQADPGYDIIYVTTIFDQLSDRQTTRLVAGCYHWLKPGGVFIFANFSADMPVGERMLIAWAMDWNIRCRSEAGLRRIFARTAFGPDSPVIMGESSDASLLVIAGRE